MANGNTVIVRAPEQYVPEFCDSVRMAYSEDIKEIRQSVEGIHKRFWGLVMLGVAQLMSVAGGLILFIISRP